MAFWLGTDMASGATETVSLNIPANNCAILQQGDDLELLPAGQHFITSPNVTLRGLFTLGENQLEMPTKDMCVLSSLYCGKVARDLLWYQLHARSGASQLDDLPEVVS